MNLRFGILVGMALLAVFLVGACFWAYSSASRMHDLLAISTACAKASRRPAAPRGTYRDCMARHGYRISKVTTETTFSVR